MDFSFNEEQNELRAMARSFLEEHSSPERVREAMATEQGYDEAVWKQIATELGWPAITIPEEYDGLGLSYVELVALLEETGRALLCSPFFSTVCLATNALLVAGNPEQKAAHLPGIASGTTTATLALSESSGSWDVGDLETLARFEGQEVVLSGTKTYVPDGHTADLLVVAAREDGTSGAQGVGLYLVPADAAGVERRWLPTMDQTRKQAEVVLRDVRLPAAMRLGGEGAELDGAEVPVRVYRWAYDTPQGNFTDVLRVDSDGLLLESALSMPFGNLTTRRAAGE